MSKNDALALFNAMARVAAVQGSFDDGKTNKDTLLLPFYTYLGTSISKGNTQQNKNQWISVE